MLQAHRAPGVQRVQLVRPEPQGRLAPSGPPGQEAPSVLPDQWDRPALWDPQGQWALPVPPAYLAQLEQLGPREHRGQQDCQV